MNDAKGYATYVYGAEAIMQWKLNTDLSELTKPRIWLWYRSNWRILHIDGFEPGYVSRKISFKWSQKVGETTDDGVHIWKNVGCATTQLR